MAPRSDWILNQPKIFICESTSDFSGSADLGRSNKWAPWGLSKSNCTTASATDDFFAHAKLSVGVIRRSIPPEQTVESQGLLSLRSTAFHRCRVLVGEDLLINFVKRRIAQEPVGRCTTERNLRREGPRSLMLSSPRWGHSLSLRWHRRRPSRVIVPMVPSPCQGRGNDACRGKEPQISVER